MRQQSSCWSAAAFAMKACISKVNGSLRFGTDSHRWTSARTLAIAGASFVSAVDLNRGSISLNLPRNFATSSK